MRARSFEEIVEVTQFIPHERIVDVPSAPVQELIVGVPKFLLQERVQRIAELIVVWQYHGSWGKRGGDTAFACYRGADCGYPSATDQWEIVAARRRFDHKKFYGFGSGDELMSGRSTSSPRKMSSFDFFFSRPRGPGQER